MVIIEQRQKLSKEIKQSKLSWLVKLVKQSHLNLHLRPLLAHQWAQQWPQQLLQHPLQPQPHR